MLFELALSTGMRQGELLALTWADVDLVHSVIHVRRTYTDANLGSPKNHEKREVFVTEEIVDMLGSWWGACGKPGSVRCLKPCSYSSWRVHAAATDLTGPEVGPRGAV